MAQGVPQEVKKLKQQTMNREIKFRAYSDSFKENTMFYDVEMMLKNDGIWWVCNNKTRMFQTGSRTHAIMQFTGLHDKNGKEIYEGDILKVTDEEDGIIHALVEWGNEYPAFTLSPSIEDLEYNSLQHATLVCTCEIIGNIYENPELLEVTP